MRRRVVLSLAMICSLGLVASPAVWAQDPIHKMRRGVVNVLTGWLELPKYVQRGKQEDNPFTGIAGGLAKGAGLTLLRAGTGLYEALTFPFPYPKDYASPYEQMDLTDYAWQ